MLRLEIRVYIAFLTVLLLNMHRLDCQSYDYTLNNEKVELFISLGANLGIHLYDHFRPEEYFDDFDELNLETLWRIDRSAPNHSSIQADHWSDITLYASVLAPFSLYLAKKARHNRLSQTLLMGLQGYLIQDAMNQSVKIMSERPRPYLYNLSESVLLNRSNKNDTKSFYSGHTSTSSYFTFFCAKVISDLYPESKWLPVYWTVGAAIPAITGYLRYRAGKHFITDVFTGYIVGAGFGLLVPSFYKNRNLHVQPIPGGLHLSVKL